MIRSEMISTSLECNITTQMFEKAFNFGLDYFINPDKVVKDRTGTKERSLGQILEDQMIGKIVEYGVCKILEQNQSDSKEIIPDDTVQSEFEYGQPDVIKVKYNAEEREPHIFLEIKNSPKNYEWISVYDSQFEGMNKWKTDNPTKKIKSEKIFVIFASLLDKHGERVFVNDVEESTKQWLNEDDLKKVETTKIKLITEVISELGCNNNTSEKIVLLDKSEEKNIDKLSEETLRGIKNLINLKNTFKKRKKDVLGSFLKYKKLSTKFDFFFNLDDYKVKIDYVVSGKELDPSTGVGRKFPKDVFWPSPEIFWVNGDHKPSTIKIRSTAKGKKCGTLLSGVVENGEKKKLTSKYLESNTLIWKNPNYWHYPKQFGDISFTEKVKVFVKETKSTGKLKKDQERKNLKSIVVECKNKTTASSTFLGDFVLEPGTWKINVWSKMEGLKKRDDYAIAKRYYDQYLSDKTLERIISIAKNI